MIKVERQKESESFYSVGFLREFEPIRWYHPIPVAGYAERRTLQLY